MTFLSIFFHLRIFFFSYFYAVHCIQVEAAEVAYEGDSKVLLTVQRADPEVKTMIIVCSMAYATYGRSLCCSEDCWHRNDFVLMCICWKRFCLIWKQNPRRYYKVVN